VSWVKPASVHLTLKFLGDVPANRIDRVIDGAERAARVTGAFEINIAGTGCFPSARNPRVLWVGLSALPDELLRLHAALEKEMEARGFDREHKRFAPHLTIGRIRSKKNSAALADKLIEIGLAAESFETREIIVMKSDLNPAGSIHTPLKIIPLARRPL